MNSKEHIEIVSGLAPEGLTYLRSVSKPVEKFDAALEDLVETMFASMRKASGVGLSAIQIGHDTRVMVVEHKHQPEIKPFVLVNPEITWQSKKEVEDEEGCLSFPNLFGMVHRAEKIAYKGFDVKGEPISGKASGLFARIIQHELDHLNGVLFIDRAEGDVYTYEKQLDTEEL